MTAAQRRQRRRLKARNAAMVQAAAQRAADFPHGILQCASGAETRPEWIEAAAEGGAKIKKFTGVAYTGGLMKVGFGRPVVINLEGLTQGSEQIPFLKDHNPESIVGHGIAEIGKRQIKVSGSISGTGVGAQEVVGLAANDFPWQMSVGVEPTKTDFIDAGETSIVNGRTVAGPAYVIRAGLLREVSFVAIGADGKTSGNIAAHISRGGDLVDFETWVSAQGFVFDELSDKQVKVLRAAYAASQKEEEETELPVKVETDVDAIVAKAVETAVAQVQDRSEIAGVYASFANQIDADKMATIRASAAAHSWNRDRIELECRRQARPAVPAIHARDNSQISAAAIEAGLLRSYKVNPDWIEAHFDEEVLATSDLPQYRRMSLHKVMGLMCQAAGIHAPVGDAEELVRQGYKAHAELVRFDPYSSLSLSGILGNTANKAMLAAYDAVEVTWPKICATRNHNDFKTHTNYRMDPNGQFAQVGATGDLKLISMQSTSFTNALGTYGAILSITRRDQINDDMNAFLQVPQALGRLSALKIEQAVYELILGGINNVFFTSTNANYYTSSGALSITSLRGLAQKFMDQVDLNLKPVLITPKYLVVGTALKTTAENLFKETNIVSTTTANAPLPSRNEHAGLYEPVVSAFINNTRILTAAGAAITGQTSTGFGLFADPNVRAAVALAFLNGQSTPTIESSSMDFSQLGMQFRGYVDFGVGFEDPAAAAWATGL